MKEILYSFIPYIVSFVGFLLIIFAKPRDFSRFSLKNHYPYEILKEEKSALRYCGFAFLLLGFGGLTYAPIHLLTNTYGETNSFLFLFIVLIALFVSSLLGYFVYSFHTEKFHFASFGVALLSQSVLSLMEGLYLLGGRFQNDVIWPSILCSVLLFVFALLPFFPFLFKKTYHWNQMDKVIEKDGTSSYQRPKIISLCLWEWGIIVLHFFSELIWILGVSLL